MGTIHLCLPIKNIELSPLIYGFKYDKRKTWRSIEKIDTLCGPSFPDIDELSHIEYINKFQKKINLKDKTVKSGEFITSSIRIGDKLNPFPKK
ncbi:hypothetical protein Elgi_30860 [Paenibacillus elgii]|nr:hypothetical protein Elgi_30860 [Paenibacillus elgii]